MKKCLVGMSVVLGVLSCAYCANYPADLIYYSKLDSATDVLSPSVGAAGSTSGMTFQSGKDGNALYVADHVTLAYIPFSDGLGEKCCVEFDLKLMKSSQSCVSGGCDPFFLGFSKEDTPGNKSRVLEMMFSANNGAGKSGLCFGGSFVKVVSTWDTFKSSFSYSDILGTEDPMGWHHYKLVWNSKGINVENDTLAVYIDGRLHKSGIRDAGEIAEFVVDMQKPLTLEIGVTNSNSPYLLDNLKIWKTDTPKEEDDPVLPVVSDVTAKQHYPWCGKIDIGYTIAGATDGLLVKITVKDNDNDLTYEAKSFDVVPTAAVGTHSVVWDATKDGVNKVSRNMVATVSLVVPEN